MRFPAEPEGLSRPLGNSNWTQREMTTENRRMMRERQTMDAMLAMYCRDQHGTAAELCQACGQLQAYALERLSRCPFQLNQPTCSNCTVHCYRAGTCSPLSRAGEDG